MIHLHTHSMYSLRDSIIRPEELIEKLKKLNMPAVAITDHGNTLGAVKFYKLCKANNIKFIYGCEMYICDDVSVKEKSETKNYHLILLAKNEVGRLNLNRLITISNKSENKYYKPRIDFSILKQYSEGLIALSACLVGEVAYLILNKDMESATEKARQYKELFKDDYYIELQARPDKAQININQQLVKIAKNLNIECVTTCDAHYLDKENSIYQSNYAFGGVYKEDTENYIGCYIQSEEEVRQNLNYFDTMFVDKLIRNTHKIADKCEVEIPLSPPIIPQMKTPPQYKDNNYWLHDICVKGLKDKLNIDYSNPKDDREQKYIDRYKYEFNALKSMGFIDYILLVYTYANYVEKRGIARGSGGGSLINYITNITDIDPLEYDLFFERFIDVGAIEKLKKGEITKKELKIPDIDLDFSSDCLGEVLLYLQQTYGEDRVASIGKFGYDLTKGTIRDMCRPLDIPLDEADSIAKSFEEYSIEDIDNMVSGVLPKEERAKTAIENTQRYAELFDYVRHLNNLPKSFGLHACGKIIAIKDLDYYMPSAYDKNGIRFLMGDMHDCDDLGLVKIDLLGLRTIDVEYNALELLNENNTYISPRQNMSDRKVLDIFKTGDTTGIFQFSSNGMKQVLKKMNVNSIDDIIAANALYRPGSLEHIDLYCKRKSGEEEIKYLHPSLEPILKATYGILIYQEQLIQIGRIAGLKNPDLLRKATGKKDIKLINQIKPELFDNLKKQGWSEEQLENLWGDMLNFARYSFNKSHAAAYSIIAYMTAKIKAYHPAVFYASILNSYIGRSEYVKECAEEYYSDMCFHNIQIANFDWRKDHRKCSVDEEGKVVYAISLIRDMDNQTAEILYKTSQELQGSTPFVCDLFKKLVANGVAKSKLEILINLGFFNSISNKKRISEMYSLFQLLKNGEAVRVFKKKVPDTYIEAFSNNCVGNNKDGSESASFTIQNLDKLLKDLWDSTEHIDIDLEKDLLAEVGTQTKYLGFVKIATNLPQYKRLLYITKSIPLKSKYDTKPWGYTLKYCALGSGICSTLTLLSGFEKEPITENNIIFAKALKKNRERWYLTDYKNVTERFM